MLHLGAWRRGISHALPEESEHGPKQQKMANDRSHLNLNLGGWAIFVNSPGKVLVLHKPDFRRVSVTPPYKLRLTARIERLLEGDSVWQPKLPQLGANRTFAI